MHSLLKADPQNTQAAQAACVAWIEQCLGRWRLASRLLSEPLRSDLLVVLSWHVLLSQEAAKGALIPEIMVWHATLSECFAPNPTRILARALRRLIRDHGLDRDCLEMDLEAHLSSRRVGSFETRPALLRLARQHGRGTGRMLLVILGKRTQRNEILVDALASAWQLIHWLTHLRAAMDRGFLPLAIEDLTRHGLSPMTLHDERTSPAAQALLSDQIAWIRELLGKGWPLCLELGWYRGRLLAFLLRLQAARLGRLEAQGLSLFAAPTRAGWLGKLACLVLSIATRSAPSFARDPGR